MSVTGVVRARIDPLIKQEAGAVLQRMGLSLSDAIRIMLVRVAAEQALPFDIRVPNARTRAAIREAQEGRAERFDSIEDLMVDLNSADE